MAEEQKIVVEQDKKRLYIKWDITGDQLKETFSKFGAVADARVVPTGRIRPFGFVTFESEADAAKAMAAMQGETLTTQPLTVEYAAGPKEKKPKQVKQPKAPAAAAEPAAAAAPKKQRERKPRAEKPAGDAAASASPAAGDASPAADGEKKAKKPRNRRKKNADGAAPAAAEAAPQTE